MRILQLSAATGRVVGAPVKTSIARRRKTDKDDQKEETMRQQRAVDDSDSGGGDEAYRRPKLGGNKAVEVQGWHRQWGG